VLSCTGRFPGRRFGEALRSRSALIWASSSLADSSVGSCGTNLPSKARLSMAWRSRTARFRFASTSASTSWRIDSRRYWEPTYEDSKARDMGEMVCLRGGPTPSPPQRSERRSQN
jgi:hypothetical protein